METTKKTENLAKRSSLKNPDDIHKFLDKSKSIQFDIDNPTTSIDLGEIPVNEGNHKINEEHFLKQRKDSLKNEFKIAQDVLKTQPTDEEDDDLTEDSNEVRVNTEHNKHIDDI